MSRKRNAIFNRTSNNKQSILSIKHSPIFVLICKIVIINEMSTKGKSCNLVEKNKKIKKIINVPLNRSFTLQ